MEERNQNEMFLEIKRDYWLEDRTFYLDKITVFCGEKVGNSRYILGSFYSMLQDHTTGRENTKVLGTRGDYLSVVWKEIWEGINDGLFWEPGCRWCDDFTPDFYSFLDYSNEYYDKSVIIVDSPETSLHPVQVVKCARKIVDIASQQKNRFLILTNHPDMISGIRNISEERGILPHIRFYLSDDKGKGKTVFHSLRENIAPIFKSFNRAKGMIKKYEAKESGNEDNSETGLKEQKGQK